MQNTGLESTIWFRFFPTGDMGNSLPITNIAGQGQAIALNEYRLARRQLAHDAIRVLLLSVTGITYTRLPIHITPSGKPIMTGNLSHYSISMSYTDYWGVVALSRNAVGIDVEGHTVSSNWYQRVNCLAGHELILTNHCPVAQWTVIEACIKLVDGAISHDLPHLRPQTPTPAQSTKPCWRSVRWAPTSESLYAQNIDAPAGYKAAIAAGCRANLVPMNMEKPPCLHAC